LYVFYDPSFDVFKGEGRRFFSRFFTQIEVALLNMKYK
jgi:hypothetical protein